MHFEAEDFQVEKEILPDKHHALLTVTFTPQVWERAKRRAARELSKEIKIPGFRPGKAPYAIVARRVGEGVIIEEAIDDLLDKYYGAILELAEVTPATPGQLKEIAKTDPLTLVIEVPLEAEVELPDYGAVRVPYEPPQVDEEDIDSYLESFRRIFVRIEPVDRPAQMGDVMVMDLTTTIYPPAGEEGEPEVIEEDEVALLVKEADDPEEWPFPGFGKALEGVKPGDEKELTYEYPDDYPDEVLRGRKVVYKLVVKEVQTPVVPELTDEFVRENTEHESVEALRAAVRADLEKRRRRDYDRKYVDQVLDTLTDQSTIRIAEAVIDEEVAKYRNFVEQFLNEQHSNLTEMLEKEGKTEEEFMAEIREQVIKTLQHRFVLQEIAVRENIEIDTREIEPHLLDILGAILENEGEKGLQRLLKDKEATRILTAQAFHDALIAKVRGHLLRIAKGEAEAEDEAAAEGQAEVETPAAGEAAEAPGEEPTPAEATAETPQAESQATDAATPQEPTAAAADDGSPQPPAGHDEPAAEEAADEEEAQ